MAKLRIVFLGDLVGRPGIRALRAGLPELMRKTGAHLAAINGENAQDGLGLSPEDLEQIFASGIRVVTTGNHVWRCAELRGHMDGERHLLRPENYPPGTPGHGSVTVEAAGGLVAFLNLQGREGMNRLIDCPFRVGREAAARLREQGACVIVDFHAEDVREKEGMAYYLDGQVSAVLGTHTHVQTADERILPGGSAAISDLGMCGPERSVIGMAPEHSVRRFLTQLPVKNEVKESPASLDGVLLTLDSVTGGALDIQRIHHCVETP